jgi:kynurenine 3-monooxygenase
VEKIVIVGAGLVGSLQAIFMARKGYKVEVYERRADMRTQEMSAGRSINLALSMRGWKALSLAEVDEKVKQTAIPMYGRIMHDEKGKTTFQPYGTEDQAIYSVSRGGLNQTLMNCAEAYENVSFHFDHRCVSVGLKENRLDFKDKKGDKITVEADRIFATDGAFSAVRNRMQRQDRFDFQQFYLPHGYKELTIPAGPNGKHLIDKNALHIWPRGNYMLIALANEDGSFTCTLFFPFEGKNSFSAIQDEQQLNTFFKEIFPDAYALMPELTTDYFENPTSSLVTIRCYPYHYEDKVLLMGDAGHAIVPFYGQGMNSGFEDCTLFDRIFEEENRNWESAFSRFSTERKADADAISELAIQNFIEMRDKVADPQFLLRKKIEKKLHTQYPDLWVPQYSQVTFSHIPYAKALENGRKQEKIMDEIMAMDNIDKKWDSTEVEQKAISLWKNSMLLILLCFSFFNSTVQAQSGKDIFPLSREYKNGFFYLAPSLTYTIPTAADFFEGEARFLVPTEGLANREGSHTGKFGYGLELGWYHSFEQRYFFNWLEAGVAYRMFAGEADLETGDPTNALAATTSAQTSFNSHQGVAVLRAIRADQLGKFTFLTTGLGINGNYVFSESFDRDPDYAPFAEPVQDDIFGQVHFQLGVGFRMAEKLLLIPSVEVPVVNVYPDFRSPTLTYFNGEYLPLIFSLRFMFLRNDPLNCNAPVYEGFPTSN